MPQQTAVEFLVNELEFILELYNSEWDEVYTAAAQAKAMEKEQIINAIDSQYNYDKWTKQLPTLGEQYYNEKYNK